MASSDEEDLAALRNAALASMKSKQPDIEPPQGIQVVSSLTSLQSVGQEFEPQVQEAFIPQKEEEQFVSEFGEVPVEFQQAVYQHQNRRRGYGRGNFRQRGFQRGRGRGRGRGFNNFQPQPPPQSALIVIQVEGSENKNDTAKEEKKESRPLLLRPQDKWAFSDLSLQSSSPTRPKDTSKFRRYDADSDSEEEDEAADSEEEGQEETNYYPENTEDVDAPDDESEEAIDSDSKVDESDSDTYSDVIIDTAKQEEAAEKDLPEASEPRDENLSKSKSDLNETNTADQSLVSTSESNTSDAEIPSDVSKVLDDNEEEAVKAVEEAHDDNCDMEDSTEASSSDEVAVNTENNSPKNVIRNEDSISNSYTTFSRFNRRSRRKSDSGDDSSVDSSNESVNDRNSVTSHSAKFVLGSSSESENESEFELVDIKSSPELVTANSPKDTSPIKEPTTVSVSNTPSNSPSHKSHSASSSSLSSSSESSSSSGSDSSSGSSSESDSNSRGSSPAPSVSSVKHSRSSAARKLDKSAKDSEKQSSKSDSPKLSSRNSQSRSSKSASPKSSRRHSHPKNYSDRRSNSSRNNDRSVSPSPEKVSQYRRYSPVQRKGSLSSAASNKIDDKKNTYKSRKFSDEIVADPEFDAANYRDEGVYRKNNAGQDRLGRNQSRDNGRKDSANRSSEGKPERHGKASNNDIRDKEARHFKDITKLKETDKRSSKYSTDSQKISSENLYKSKNASSKDFTNRRVHEEVSKIQKTGKTLSSGSVSTGKGSRHNSSKKENYSRNSSRSITPEQNRRTRTSKSPVDEKRKHNSHGSGKGQNKDIKSSKSEETKLTKRADKNEKISKSNEKSSRRKSSEMKSENKNEKTDKNIRRKSIHEKLKKMAGVDIDSGSDSEKSDKSVSSLSDISSESESGTWRNKKAGASRDTDDIERERRRRRLQNREKRRDSEKGRSERRSKYDDHDLRDSVTGGRKISDWGNTSRGGRDRGGYIDDRKHPRGHVKERYHNSKKMVFYEEKLNSKKKAFEELSSGSDSSKEKDRVQRGFVTVIQNEKAKRSGNIPSLMDLKVSKPSKHGDSYPKRSKKERLVIQVAQSSDDEEEVEAARRKKHKKHSKGKRSRTSDDGSEQEEEEWSRKQTVNVTFDKDIKTTKSKLSVYDRLGSSVSRKVAMDKPRSDSSRVTQEIVVPPGGKRIKLNEKGKYQDTDSKQTEGGDDSALNKRIQKIQAKNAEILRRKKEVEYDKQRYG